MSHSWPTVGVHHINGWFRFSRKLLKLVTSKYLVDARPSGLSFLIGNDIISWLLSVGWKSHYCIAFESYSGRSISITTQPILRKLTVLERAIRVIYFLLFELIDILLLCLEKSIKFVTNIIEWRWMASRFCITPPVGELSCFFLFCVNNNHCFMSSRILSVYFGERDENQVIKTSSEIDSEILFCFLYSTENSSFLENRKQSFI